MKPASHDRNQAMQRVRVGLTGLAVVLVLIGIASAIFTSANRGQPASFGVSNMVATNLVDPDGNVADGGREEPLAEIGAAPSTGATTTPDSTAPAR